MKYDNVAIQSAERAAFELLTNPVMVKKLPDGSTQQERNPYWVTPINVTSPAKLVQEQPFVNTSNTFEFDFSLQAQPAGASAPGTNNVILGKNNVAVIYGLQILQREGLAASPATGIYRSRGITPNDDSLYNSVIQLKVEQSTLVDKMAGQDFRDVFNSPLEFDSKAGMLLWQPLRIVTGELGTFKIIINILGSISGVVLSPNIFISVRPLIVFGQAQA